VFSTILVNKDDQKTGVAQVRSDRDFSRIPAVRHVATSHGELQAAKAEISVVN